MNLTDVDNRNVEVALQFLEELCSKYKESLDLRESKILECALQNETVEGCYQKYRACFGDSIQYIKTSISPNLWEKVSRVMHEEIRHFKPSFPYHRLGRTSIWGSLALLLETKEIIIEEQLIHPKLHQVPQLENCYGRKEEIEQLTNYILQEGKRGVFVIGLSGIGKATLVNQLIHERVLSSNKFTHIFWCPVRHTTVSEVITSILRHFRIIDTRDVVTNVRSTPTKSQMETSLMNQLVDVLHQHSILLVFPDWCSLLSDQESGHYLAEAQSYKQLLDMLLRRRHRSCVLVLSSQLPDLHHQVQPGHSSNVAAMVIRGLDITAAQELLINHLPQFDQSPKNMVALKQLVIQYGGHPWALTRLADIIVRSFDHNIHALLRQQTIILDDPLEQLLANQFQRWEALEKKLLFHLSLACRPLTQLDLYILCCKQTPNSTLLNRLRKLSDRGVVYTLNTPENTATPRYFVEPIVQKYLQNQFIEICSQEILALAEDPQPQRLNYVNDYYLAESPLTMAASVTDNMDVICQQQVSILRRIFLELNAMENH